MRPTAALVLLTLLGCASSLPPRYVVERNLGDYEYRRYQRTLDVEFRVPNNPAEGHTAAYVAGTSESGRVRVATAFVTVYERGTGLAAYVKAQIEGLGSYESRVVRESGEYVWSLDGGDDRWLVWVSGRHVVKLGAEGQDVPDDVADRYLSLYPSDLNRYGRADEGAESAGTIEDAEAEAEEPPMPSSLRDPGAE